MKHIILVLIMLTPLSTYATTYWHAYDWFEQRHALNLQSTIFAANDLQDYNNEPLFSSTLNGFVLKDDKLHWLYDDRAFQQVGRLERCDGLADTCVIMDGYFRLYLPKDFDFNQQRKWTWGTCQYTANTKTKSKILGVQVDQVHVNAICSDYMFELIEFDIDKSKGVTSIALSATGIRISYILATDTGFFARDPQGHYSF